MTIPKTECPDRVRWASGDAKSGSDRGQFVDVIDENAFRAKGASESVEWSSGRPVVIFNFSIKAQVGRLMVAICSSGCVSTVDLTSVAVAWISRQYANSSSVSRRGSRTMSNSFRRRRKDFGTNIKIGRWALRWCGTRALAAPSPSRRWHTGRNRFDNLEVGSPGPRAAAHYL